MTYYAKKSEWAQAKAEAFRKAAREVQAQHVDMGRYAEKRRQLEYLRSQASVWEARAGRYRREEPQRVAL